MKVMALLFLASSLSAQMPMGGVTANGVSCNPPTMTSRWAAYNSSNLCTGSVACTNGATVISVPDFLGTLNSSSANPVYATGSVNGLPTLSFAASQQVILSGNFANSGAITFYAVLKPTSSATNRAIIGAALNSSLEWRVNSAGKSELLSQGTASIGTSTSTVSTAGYSTIALTYTFSTGALTFYQCSSGTCNTDGTATATASFGSHQGVLGFASVVNEQFLGNIAEWGYLTSSNVSGIAAWSQCKYGI